MLKLMRVFLVFVSVFVLMSGCAQEKPKTNLENRDNLNFQDNQENREISPKEFFPTEIGTRWAYKITLGKIEPLNLMALHWSTSDQNINGFYYGYYLGSSKFRPQSTYDLVYSIKTKSSPESKYFENVDLEIEKDDLGIFKEASGVFWRIVDEGNISYDVTLEIRFPANASIAPKINPASLSGESYTARTFFAKKVIVPDLDIYSKKVEVNDELVFKGLEKNRMHFQRIVKPDKNSAQNVKKEFTQPFTEDMWFEKGKGLVRLEQRIDKEISMIWVLERFEKK